MFFSLKLAIILGLVLGIGIVSISGEISINSYENPNFPGQCVLDVQPSVVILKAGEAFKMPNMDCVTFFCMSQGWGMLFTCETKAPPDDCRFSESLNPDAFYPECCKRRVICD